MTPKRATSPGFSDPRYRAVIDRLRARRLELGMTQEALGSRLGLHKQFVSRFELGERRLDVVEFNEVATALGLVGADLARDSNALISAAAGGYKRSWMGSDPERRLIAAIRVGNRGKS